MGRVEGELYKVAEGDPRPTFGPRCELDLKPTRMETSPLSPMCPLLCLLPSLYFCLLRRFVDAPISFSFLFVSFYFIVLLSLS